MCDPPSSKDKPHEVTLSGFMFANQQTSPDQSAEERPDLTENPSTSNQGGSHGRRPESYERMEVNNLGQELDDTGAIWKLYREEADEHDQELVRSKHASLDVMLLFAALFSAILTAFLIESKDLLQQDPADASVALLLSIAQSQYRLEHGMTAPSDDTSLPSIPDFSPSHSARWINGIWFSSLALSLSAALIAMLSKEWLTAFLGSRPRPAHDHALLRQARMEGLERWWALHIVALLPSLLHASLLLFAVGLVIYLWTLDETVAAVLIAIIASTVLFYAVTVVLGAVYEFCPYVTQLSGYLRTLIIPLFSRTLTTDYSAAKYPVLKDLQALLWLASNARDPVVVDCSYQAMAGLQPPTSRGSDLNTSSSPNLLAMTESVWGNDNTPLNPNTYASILVSAMDIIQLVAFTSTRDRVSSSKLPFTGQADSSDSNGLVDDSHAINMNTFDFTETDPNSHLMNLRAYYSRWLARTSTLIILHASQKIVIDPWLLRSLLGAITVAACSDILNPQDSISTHHPQSDNPESVKFKFAVPTNVGRPHFHEVGNLRTGPLGSVIRFLKHNITDRSQMQPCLAAVQTYSALAPVTLQQAFKLNKSELIDAYNIENWELAPRSSMFGIRFIVTRQALLTIRYLGLSRTLSSSSLSLLKVVMALLDQCLSADNGSAPARRNSHFAFANHNSDLIPLLEFVSETKENMKRLPNSVKSSLLTAVRMPFTSSGATSCDNLLTPVCFPTLIAMIPRATVKSSHVTALLQAIVRRMRADNASDRPQRIPWNNLPAIEYLYHFTRTPQGFASLTSACRHKTHGKAALTATIDIIHLASGRDPSLTVQPVELSLAVVPELLEVVSVVVERRTILKDYRSLMPSFFSDVLELTKIAAQDNASMEILRQHPVYKEIWAVLKGFFGNDQARTVKAQYRDMEKEFEIIIEDTKGKKKDDKKEDKKAEKQKEKTTGKEPSGKRKQVVVKATEDKNARVSGDQMEPGGTGANKQPTKTQSNDQAKAHVSTDSGDVIKEVTESDISDLEISDSEEEEGSSEDDEEEDESDDSD
ncbi:hypothetical protein FRC07_015109 [Ceratobasidium sp. 392]|nr:hypothetical protein FRC07_015109 [Ceratobasidium sp. 392]